MKRALTVGRAAPAATVKIAIPELVKASPPSSWMWRSIENDATFAVLDVPFVLELPLARQADHPKHEKQDGRCNRRNEERFEAANAVAEKEHDIGSRES